MRLRTDEIRYRARSLRVLTKVHARQSSKACEAHAFDVEDSSRSFPLKLVRTSDPPTPSFWEALLEEAQRRLPGEVRRAGAEGRVQRGLSDGGPKRAK